MQQGSRKGRLKNHEERVPLNLDAVPSVVTSENSSAALRLTWTSSHLVAVPEAQKVERLGAPQTVGRLLAAAAFLGATTLIAFGPTIPNVAAGLSLRELAGLLVIAFLSGIMSGFSGFGFSAIGAAALLFLPPILQVPLFQALSTGNQLLSAGKLRGEMPKSSNELWAGPGPCMLGGLIGAPIGIWILAHLPPARLMAVFGVLLTAYAAYSYLKPPTLKLRGLDSPVFGVAVGLLGGMVGGFTAFPGAPVVVWIGLRGLSKAQHRAVLQPYLIMSQIYALVLVALLHPSYLGSQFWILLALGMPAVIPGTLSGVAIYKRISDVSFKRFLYVPLAVSGVSLLVKAFGPVVKRLIWPH